MPCGMRIGRRGRFESFKARKRFGKEDERGKASQRVWYVQQIKGAYLISTG